MDWVPALSPPLEDAADDAVLLALLLPALALAPESLLPTLPPLLPLAALSLAPVLAPSLLGASCVLGLAELAPLRKSVTYQPVPFN